MIRFIKWFFFGPDNHIVELEEKYQGLLQDVRRLEEENIENTNLIYELMHSLDAVDRRIDILADEWGKEKNV